MTGGFRRGGAVLYVVVAIVAAVLTVAAMALYSNIATRKAEATQTVFKVTEIDETTIDPAEWGKNYPRQYDSYKRTVDTERTRYGGSEAIDKLDLRPEWKTLWDGYAFAIDFREERGHAYMLHDQRETRRVTERQQPGACLHCHASVVDAYREVGMKEGAPGALTDPLLSAAGQAQLFKGFEAVCAMPYDEATSLVEHPVTCLDCHDPSSMQLRVTRPGFLNGIRVLAESNDPLPHLPSVERWRTGLRERPYDPNLDASRQEMRSMVCSQCHVEYYFKGEGKLLTYPWHKGLKIDDIQAYYDEIGFKDWTHAVTGAPMLKAQHPEFELWSQGVHARSGVSCADCHMPYIREGAIKVSSHHVRSPMLNVARSCQTCHRYDESEILARVEAIQSRTESLLKRGETAVMALVGAIETAIKAGASDADLEEARRMHRLSQFRLDFVYAENSMGFHAPQEAARILAEAIDFARQGEIAAIKATPGGATRVSSIEPVNPIR